MPDESVLQSTSESSLGDDTLLSPLESLAILPFEAKRNTVYAWCSRGIRGRRLASTRVAGRRQIRVADLRLWVDWLTLVAEQRFDGARNCLQRAQAKEAVTGEVS